LSAIRIRYFGAFGTPAQSNVTDVASRSVDVSPVGTANDVQAFTAAE
jgi:hypothetical protein